MRRVWFTTLATVLASIPAGSGTVRMIPPSSGRLSSTWPARAVSRSSSRGEPSTTSELVAGSTAITISGSSTSTGGFASVAATVESCDPATAAAFTTSAS